MINESYVQVGAELYKQAAGIGIGIPSSGEVADNTLFVDEWNHIEQVLLGPKQHEARKIQGYAGVARIVDDQVALTTCKWIIPPPETYGLKYSSKEVNATSVVFCGYEVTFTQGNKKRIVVDMAEKQSAFEMLLTRWPHIQSCMTKACRIGCVITCLTYAHKRNSDDLGKERFLVAMVTLFNILVQRGFTEAMMTEGIRRFTHSKHLPDSTKERKRLQEKLNATAIRCFETNTGPKEIRGLKQYYYPNTGTMCWASVGTAILARIRHTFGENAFGVDREHPLGKAILGLFSQPTDISIYL